MYSHLNILLVEDNPGDAFLIKEMLSASDFNSANLLTATTLKEALKYGFTDKEIPLILLDLGLPDSDGMESVRTVRKNFPDAALNILTGFSDKHTASLALREGAQNYLVKGEIDSNELEEAIRYSIERLNFISRLKDANQSLKLSEEKYKLLFKNNPMPMWVIDYKNDLRFLDVNQAAVQHYGYTREEFLSMSSTDIRPESEKEKYEQLHRDSRPHATYVGTWKHMKKDGTIINVEISTHDIIFDNKEARLILANDITEKLKALEKLIRSEEQYKDLVENITDLICTHDLNGKILSSNKAASEITGYDFNPEKNWNIRDILSADKKDGFDEYITAIKEKGHAEGLMKVRTQSGEIRIWEYQNTLKADGVDGPIVRGYARDITERRKAEEALRYAEINYRELFEKANDAIYVHEMETGRVLQVNQRATELTGYTKEEILTTDPHEFMSGDPRYTFEHAINYIQKAAAGEPQLFEWLGKRKDGTLSWYEVSLKRATVAGEDRILAFFHEINQRKKAEDELIDSQNTLRELTAHLQTVREEERKHLAREVHDVLGQQITGLKMDMTWLNKKISNKDQDVKERFTEMLALADEMVKTVRKISTELRPGILDDLGLVPALEWQSSEFEKRTGIKCQFTSHHTLPDITQINATGIFRIYQETLTNVARHAQATKVDASVTFSAGAITLTIADNGRGLDPASLKARKTLGIVGMKERAAMMKGNLTVQPRTEGGTVVTLSVPALNKTDV